MRSLCLLAFFGDLAGRPPKNEIARDAEAAEKRQTTRIRMNAPQVVRNTSAQAGGAMRSLCLLAFFGDLAVRPPKNEIARDAEAAEERQTTRIRMNAPQVYAIRLRKPAEPCAPSASWRSSATWRFDLLRMKSPGMPRPPKNAKLRESE